MSNPTTSIDIDRDIGNFFYDLNRLAMQVLA